MDKDGMIGRVGSDIWVKYTDKNGAHHTSHHRVWDVGLFMENRMAEAKKAGGTAELVMKPPLQKRT